MWLLLISGLLSLGLSACGNTSSDTQAQPGASGGDASTAASAPEEWRVKSFIVRGGDNSIQRFGEEGTPQERKQINAHLEAFMQARAAGDWKTMCHYLAPRERGVMHVTIAKAGGTWKGCVSGVAALIGASPPSARMNTMAGPVVSVRQEGSTRAYALYHGKNGVDYAMPMLTHYGDWEVAALAPSELG